MLIPREANSRVIVAVESPERRHASLKSMRLSAYSCTANATRKSIEFASARRMMSSGSFRSMIPWNSLTGGTSDRQEFAPRICAFSIGLIDRSLYLQSLLLTPAAEPQSHPVPEGHRDIYRLEITGPADEIKDFSLQDFHEFLTQGLQVGRGVVAADADAQAGGPTGDRRRANSGDEETALENPRAHPQCLGG